MMHQQQQKPQHGQNRRMFRGRGGANDRSVIPDKSILLAKRKAKKYVHQTNTSNYTTDNDNNTIDENDNTVNTLPDDTISNDNHTVENDGNDSFEEVVERVSQEQNLNNNDEQNEQCIIEIQQFISRMHNIRLSIQRSSVATLSQPPIYQSNVLFAIQKCVKIWSTIILHYDLSNRTSHVQHNEQDVSNNSDTANQIALITKVALQLFELIQLSVQCGPLHGCKPGYFKRCGYDVCVMVEQYLQTIISCYPKSYADIPVSSEVEGDDNDEKEQVNDCEGTHVNDTDCLVQNEGTPFNDNDCLVQNDKGIVNSSDIESKKTKDEDMHSECAPESQVDDAIMNSPNSEIDSSDTASSDDNFANRYRSNQLRNEGTNTCNSSNADSGTDGDQEDGEEDTEEYDDNYGNHSMWQSIGTKNPRTWDELFFTSQQVVAIHNWLKACQKQTSSGKERLPSRHIQKLQEEGCKNSIRKKQLRQKKKEKQNKKYQSIVR